MCNKFIQFDRRAERQRYEWLDRNVRINNEVVAQEIEDISYKVRKIYEKQVTKLEKFKREWEKKREEIEELSRMFGSDLDLDLKNGREKLMNKHDLTELDRHE